MQLPQSVRNLIENNVDKILAKQVERCVDRNTAVLMYLSNRLQEKHAAIDALAAKTTEKLVRHEQPDDRIKLIANYTEFRGKLEIVCDMQESLMNTHTRLPLQKAPLYEDLAFVRQLLSEVAKVAYAHGKKCAERRAIDTKKKTPLRIAAKKTHRNK